MTDELMRAGWEARRAELRDCAAPRPARPGALARTHLRLWWATRPRRDMRCLVTSADGLSVLAGGPGR